MNIDLTKKYKKEFDHWLNKGNLLTRTKSNFIWNDKINEDLMWDFESDIVFKYDDTTLAPDSNCCIKWAPQASELCVYPNGFNSFSCSKFVCSEEQQLGKGTITLALFENGDSYNILTIEPFLNSKPSWFKD